MLPWCPDKEHLSMGGRLGLRKTQFAPFHLPPCCEAGHWVAGLDTAGPELFARFCLHQIETKSEL